MSIKILSHIWQTSTVSGSKLLVLLALADFSDDEGKNIFPSMQTLAKKARLSVDQTRRVIHQLIEDGEIELVMQGGWRGKRNLANEYRIVLDRTCNLQAPRADASTRTRADASTVPAPMQDQSSYNRHKQPEEEKPPPPPVSPGNHLDDDYAEIVKCYQANIGIITETVGEKLKGALEENPAEWIKEAIQESAIHNKRSWAYAEKILSRWAREGRGPRASPNGVSEPVTVTRVEGDAYL